MVIKQATEQDFAYAFSFIEKLWDYNVYDKETVKSVYKEVLADDKSFAFFLCDEKGNYCGFCHGSFSRHSGCPVRPAIWPVLSRMKSIGEWDMAGLWWTM